MSDEDMRISEPRFLIRDQALDRLRGAIVSGRYKPGTRLIERELCDILGVSRTSVREALRQLEAERLVTVRPRSGPEVTTITRKEAADLYELRTVLEGSAVRLFIERADEKEIAALAKLSENFKRAAQKNDMPRMISSMAEFYDTLLVGTRNDAMRDYSRQLRARVDFLRLTSMSQPGRTTESVREIAAIVKAIEKRDPEAAYKASTNHVQRAAATALSMLKARDSSDIGSD